MDTEKTHVIHNDKDTLKEFFDSRVADITGIQQDPHGELRCETKSSRIYKKFRLEND